MANAFSTIKTFVLSQDILERSVLLLRQEGGGRVESLVFWGGAIRGETAYLTHIFVPKGPGVIKGPFYIRISDGIIAALAGLVDPPRLVVLGQVHTHKFEAFHSPTDDANSLDTPGFLSVVIPRFAAAGAATWGQWSFFECLGSGRFRELVPSEVAERIRVESSGAVEVCDVTA